MISRPRSFTTGSHRLWVLSVILFLGTLMPSELLAAGQTVLRPVGAVEQVPVGRKARPYLLISDQPVVIPVTGPGQITGYARVAMAEADSTLKGGVLEVSGVPGLPATLPMEFKPSSRGTWGDDRTGRPSAGKKLSMDVPAGTFDLSLTANVTDGSAMLVLLYYDGPDQPRQSALMPTVVVEAQKKAKAKQKTSPWKFRASAGLDLIYNDNVLSDSVEYQDDFISGEYFWKFHITSTDDLITAPSIDLQAERKFFDLGKSRFRFKLKHWLYTHNSIKTNTDFHFYVRQYVGKKQSLEFYFHFAPEQYIRHLSDRPPHGDPDLPIEWKEFRFQRNVWNLTWRQTISKKLSATVLFEENYRYYNQPFMENDIHAWEIRGVLYWKINKTWKTQFDYSYEDGQGQGFDTVGEGIGDSDDSDPSYLRDLYRVGVTYSPAFLKKITSGIGASFLFMDYYYTSAKDPADDPTKVGRNDRYWKGTIEAKRKLSKSVSMKLAVRRTQRKTYSPWEGDFTTDKAFTQWLYWVNLTYKF